ncbi:hypothetical protein AB1I63_10185 [Streptococcus pneumoniae]
MKVRNMLFFLGAAAASYATVKHKERLMTSFHETKAEFTTLKNNSQRIKDNLAIIEAQKDHITDISKDLGYQFKQFEQELKARTQEMKTIWEKE